ncbi:MAG: hypothetical protein KC468_32475, partial [Myxococcales bacterium]|nr:hypothetical protein [Myxococcales bacterium]
QPAPSIVAPGGEARQSLSNAPTSPGQPLSDLWQFLSQLGTTGQVDQLLENFTRFFEQLGFNPATSAVLALVALTLYDMLWYPYYASYLLPLASFFAPALSALAALALVRATPQLFEPHPRADANLRYLERVWEPPLRGGAEARSRRLTATPR